RTPLAPLASFHRALRILREDLWKVECPVTAMISGEDNVVGPRTLRTLRANLPSPPRIVALRRSRHVATLDYDASTMPAAVVSTISGEYSAVRPRPLRPLRSSLPSPPRIFALRRSRHVPTLDYDASAIAEAVVSASRADATEDSRLVGGGE